MAEETVRDDLDRLRRERDLYLRLLRLGTATEIEPLLAEALMLIVDVVGALQGYVEVQDPASSDDAPVFSIAHDCSAEEVAHIRAKISRGIIAEALATGRTIETASALSDARFQDRASVRSGRIEAVLCAPVGEDPPFGVVYLQGRVRSGPFGSEDCERAELLARQLAPLADRLLLQRRIDADPTRPFRERLRAEGLIGRSRSFAWVLQQVSLVAPLDLHVLLTGEPGTGKSRIARAIHANSPRVSGPFVELHCGRVPAETLDRELLDRVAAARSGTLLLDAIEELPLEMQDRLLEVLQSKTYTPVGSDRSLPADVRWIVATGVSLEERVREQRFREDLLQRLQVLSVHLPTLPERREDLGLLALYFSQRACERRRLGPLELSRGALRAVEAAEWPGNLCQLETAIEVAAARAAHEGSSRIEQRHLIEPDGRGGEPLTFQQATWHYQRELLHRTLEETGWQISATARRLDLSRSHVYNLIRAFALGRKEP